MFRRPPLYNRTYILFPYTTLFRSLNGSINSMWVGSFLGARALAATTSANLIMFLLFAGVFGLAMATSILVGQSAGRGEVAKIRRAVGTSGGLFQIGRAPV